MIEVVQEQVERPDALLQAALDVLPLGRRDQARHQVEGHDLLDALGALVDGEGDATRLERQLGRALATGHLVGPQQRQSAGHHRVVGADVVRRVEHLVPEVAHVVRQRLRNRLVVQQRRVGHATACAWATGQAALEALRRPVAAPVKKPDVGATSA